jgi:ATP-binding protein involved in chromosome partitioning
MDESPSSSCDKGSCASCATPCSEASAPSGAETEDQRLQRRVGRIRRKILVMSGKGGVGKSTVAVNLAVSLLQAGKRVGLLDVDIHGPSIPQMLRVGDARAASDGESLLPIEFGALKVMSIGFLLPGPDDAVVWRGPMKMAIIRQFLQDVDWGDLDYLVVDLPPGTGDEPLSVCQLAAPVDGAVVVTTPQLVSTADVRRSIRFCQKLGVPVLGVVENMSGFACPKCGEITNIFNAGGGERMAADLRVPFLGSVPIDPKIGADCDNGTPFVHGDAHTPSSRAFERIALAILSLSKTNPHTHERTAP